MAALAAALLLHLAAALWLLTQRFELPEMATDRLKFVWQPVPAALPRPPPAVETGLPSPHVVPIDAPPLPMPVQDLLPPAVPDWSAAARDVARGFGAGPSYRPFGEAPQGLTERPQEPYPPSIWAKPLPRVGTTVTTPDGETIIWVSDYCYVSISSRSLTQKEIHDARRGVRTCVLAQFGGKKKPRVDLFDAIKRPPPPQEPGCGADGVGQSCAR